MGSYNKKKHSSTGYAPDEVLNSSLIQTELSSRNISEKLKAKREKKKPTLSLNDKVRIQLGKTAFDRSYNQRTTQEIFRIYKIEQKDRNPRYFLKDLQNEEIDGSFNRQELTRCRINQFKSSIIDRKVKNGRSYVLLDYKGYGPQFREWQLDE